MISGGGSWANQVGLIDWQENISMVKIKTLWGCSPTAQPFPLPMLMMIQLLFILIVHIVLPICYIVLVERWDTKKDVSNAAINYQNYCIE